MASTPFFSPFSLACFALTRSSNSPCANLLREYDSIAADHAQHDGLWLRTPCSGVPPEVHRALKDKYGLHRWPTKQLLGLDELTFLVMGDQLQCTDDGCEEECCEARLRLANDLRAEERVLLESQDGLFSAGYRKLREQLVRQGVLSSITRGRGCTKKGRVKSLQDAAKIYYTGLFLVALLAVVLFLVVVVFLAPGVFVALLVTRFAGAAGNASTGGSWGGIDLKEDMGCNLAILESSPEVPTSMSLPT